jgi:hypothetical protein
MKLTASIMTLLLAACLLPMSVLAQTPTVMPGFPAFTTLYDLDLDGSNEIIVMESVNLQVVDGDGTLWDDDGWPLNLGVPVPGSEVAGSRSREIAESTEPGQRQARALGPSPISSSSHS